MILSLSYWILWTLCCSISHTLIHSILVQPFLSLQYLPYIEATSWGWHSFTLLTMVLPNISTSRHGKAMSCRHMTRTHFLQRINEPTSFVICHQNKQCKLPSPGLYNQLHNNGVAPNPNVQISVWKNCTKCGNFSNSTFTIQHQDSS